MNGYLLILLISIIGEITSIYIFLKKNRNEKIICIIGKDCNEVIQSRYGGIFGIRNEVLGIVYYLFTALFVLFVLSGPAVPQFLKHLLTAVSFPAFLYSFYLTYTQLLILKKVCGLCLIANFINTIIFLLLIVSA